MVDRIALSHGGDILSIMSSCLPFGVHTYQDAIRAIEILPSWVLTSMYSAMIYSQHVDRMVLFIDAIKETAKERGISLHNCAGCNVEVKQFQKYCETCAHIEYS